MPFTKTLTRLLTIAALSIASSLSATPTADGIYAVFETSKGTFTAELYYQKAPISCASMVGLAEGTIAHYAPGSTTPIYSKFYDSLKFHRVSAGFVIQGGDPLGTGAGGPGYTFPDEVRPDLKHLGEGYLSMANSGANTNGSQFFVTLATTAHLDGKHNVFGKIVEGIEIVRTIGKVATNSAEVPTTPVVINSLKILRIGEAAIAFDPSFYANYFDPTIYIVGQPVKNDLQYVNASQREVTVTAPFKPLTDYRTYVSVDFKTWTLEDRVPPSLDPNTAPASYRLRPFANPNSPPKYVQIVATRGFLSDMDGILQSITIESESSGTSFVEKVTFSPQLFGTYKLNNNAAQSVQYDWMELSADRAQLLVRFPNYSTVQFFLNKDGTVYIHDGNYIAEGTYTKTATP